MAQSYYRVDPKIIAIYRLLEEDENDSGKLAGLLVVVGATVVGNIVPVYFESCAIVDVTLKEFDDIISGQESLPNDWCIGERIERGG